MELGLILLFVTTELMFSLFPGPAVAAVVSSSITGGYRLAIYAILGVLIANLLYFIVSAALIIAGTQAHPDYFYMIKMAGCAYLFYILYMEYMPLFFNKKKGVSRDEEGGFAKRFYSSKFLITFIMQISNPKTILFFTAFLPQFINEDYDIILQFIVLACLSFVTEFFVLFGYAIGGQAMLKYGRESIGSYAHHVGNAMMVSAVVWSVLR